MFLHDPGPNRRALRSYLDAASFPMEDVTTWAALVRTLREDLRAVGLVHAAAIDSDVASRTLPDSWRQRLLVITTPEQRSPLPTDTIAEPYLLPDIIDDLRRIEGRLDRLTAEPPALRRPSPPAAGPAPTPAPSDDSLHVDLPASTEEPSLAQTLAPILGSIGRALAPHASAADGWLQLIVQDIAADDPAQPPIGHARRELQALDRALRLLRLADDPTPPFRGSFSLATLIHEIVGSIGVTTVPVAVEVADDLSEILADPKLTRHACEGLLRGILEPGGRPDGVVIRARDMAYGVELVFIEEGHRLNADQLRELCAPGRSLLYNSPGRGLGFPMADILFRRQGVTMSIDSGDPGQLEIRIRFASASSGRGLGSSLRARRNQYEEGAR